MIKKILLIITILLSSFVMFGCVFDEAPRAFNITYVLNGGVNGNNPTTYIENTEPIILEPATNSHAEFKGWYLSEDENDTPITEITNLYVGDITLYARYTGPKIYWFTDSTDPITLYGKNIKVTATSTLIDEYLEDAETLLEMIKEGEEEYSVIENKYKIFRDLFTFLLDEIRYATIIADTTKKQEDYELKNKLNDCYLEYENYRILYEIEFANSKYRHDYYKNKTDEQINQYIESLSYDDTKKENEYESLMNNYLNDYYAGKISADEALRGYVTSANEYAKLFAYDNYLEYSYNSIYKRDYDLSSTDLLSSYLKDNIIPLGNYFLEEYNKCYDSSTTREKEEYRSYLNDFFGHHLDELDAYANRIGGYYLENYQKFFDSGNYFLSSNENDNVTGYTWSFMNGDSFIFFGRDYQKMRVFIHEFGHYNAARTGGSINKSYDLIETQSQGNELLFYYYLATSLVENKNVSKMYLYYQLYKMVETIYQGYLINKLEEMIYNANPEDLNFDHVMAYWNEIVSEYGLDKYRDKREFVTTVILNYQGYYMSYAASAISSLELLATAVLDFDSGIENYKTIYNFHSNKNYLEVLSLANLYSIFDPECYKLLENLKNINL